MKKENAKQNKTAAVLFSGGKDSALALHKAVKKGYDVGYLISILPQGEDALLFHKPDLRLLEKQAEMLSMDLILEKAGFGEKNELESLKKLVDKVKDKIDIVIIGGIASNYQAKKFKKIIKNLGLKVEIPLWDYKAEQVWRELLDEKFQVVLTKISCEGLDKKFLGRVINERLLRELEKLSEKYGFRLDFEGGEAETAVLFMPEFKKHINIKFDIRSEGKHRHFLRIKEII